MGQYKHALVAVELDPETDAALIKKAKSLAESFDAKLTLIHAVEYMSSYGAAYGVAASADIGEMLLENAQKSITKLGSLLGVPDGQQIIKIGPAKVIILEEAQSRGVDLIIIGSHGRHGLRLILGSTANTVLHGAKCDVLAIRFKE